MSTARLFSVKPERHEGRTTSVLRFTCSKCGTTGKLVNAADKTLPYDFVSKKMARLGWSIGRSDSADYCPSCTGRAPKPHLAIVPPESPMAEPAKLKTSMNITAEPPRQPTREEKRIVMDSVRERYDERAGRYLDGWTDHRIAEDLSVPRAWVADIRDEWFGAEGGNAEIDKLLAETDKLRFQLKDTEERYGKELTALANSMTVLMREVSVIRKAVGMK